VTADAYADAIVDVARGENALDTVGEELVRVARHVRQDEELYRTVTDERYPLGRRLQLVDDVLAVASDATRTAVALLVAANRVRDIEQIAATVAERAAEEHGRAVAEVWVAEPLTDEQRERLRDALERATGKQLELNVFVDESVVGGVRARIGDIVIDGSVGRRLVDLRSRVGG
jgi:F-type H+-transporting ATPase subunit delta